MSRFRYIVFRDGLVVYDQDYLPKNEEIKEEDYLYYKDNTYSGENKWYKCFQRAFSMDFQVCSNPPDQLKLAVILLGEEP